MLLAVAVAAVPEAEAVLVCDGAVATFDVVADVAALDGELEASEVAEAGGNEAALEAAEEVAEEDGGVPMLMFLMVNLPEALPLSPNKTRMYVLRVDTAGTVISARPAVIGKPCARGLLRSKCSSSPSASSKYPKTIIPLLVKPDGMTEVSHVTLCLSPTFQTVPVVG